MRQALVLALLCSCIAYLITALADTLIQVYVGRAVSGLAAGSLPIATALMADLSPPERRAKAMGLVGTAFGLGLIAGPVLGGLLTGDSQSFALPFYTAAVMSIIAAGFAQFLLPAQMAKPSGYRREIGAAATPVSVLAPARNKLLLSQYVTHTCSVSAIIYLFPLWVADRFSWGPHGGAVTLVEIMPFYLFTLGRLSPLSNMTFVQHDFHHVVALVET